MDVEMKEENTLPEERAEGICVVIDISRYQLILFISFGTHHGDCPDLSSFATR
jgi:hypothetical protein